MKTKQPLSTPTKSGVLVLIVAGELRAELGDAGFLSVLAEKYSLYILRHSLYPSLYFTASKRSTAHFSPGAGSVPSAWPQPYTASRRLSSRSTGTRPRSWAGTPFSYRRSFTLFVQPRPLTRSESPGLLAVQHIVPQIFAYWKAKVFNEV